MKNRLILGLGIIFACQEARALEPMTVAALVVAGLATAKASLKSSMGKIFIGYALGQAAATPTGKHLIMQAQNALRQKRNEILRNKIKIMRARVDALMPAGLMQAHARAKDLSRAALEKMFLSCEKSGIPVSLKSFQKNHQYVKHDMPSSQACAKNNGSSHVHIEQTHVHQELHVEPGATVTFLGANREYAHAQFWKGACIGGFVGATTMAWLDKKREENAMHYYFDNE